MTKAAEPARDAILDPRARHGSRRTRSPVNLDAVRLIDAAGAPVDGERVPSSRGGPTREVDRIEAAFELRCGDRGRLVKATKRLSPTTAAAFDTLHAGWGYTRVERVVGCR